MNNQSVREEKILKEFDKKFPNIYYIGYEELDGKKDVNSAFSREYLKDFILKSLSDQRETLKAELIEDVYKIDGATEDWREVFISIIQEK